MISKTRFNLTTLFIYIVLLIVVIVAITPVMLMWINAFRGSEDPSHNPVSIPRVWSLKSIAESWTTGRMSRYFLNSLIIIFPRVGGVLILSCLAGYGFAKLPIPGKNLLFPFILFGMTVPIQSLIIPIYYNMQRMGLINTYWALFLPAYGLAIPFGTFLMRAFFRDLPNELIESARMDGAREFTTFFKIMLPLAMPGLLTLLIFEFMWGWNDFLLPLLMVFREDYRTLPVGIIYFSSRFTTNQSLVAAGVTITTLPIVAIYIIFQRRFIDGITAGALK